MPAAKTTPLSMIKPSTKPGNLHLSTQNSSNILNPTLEDDLRVREVDSDDLPIPHLPKTSTKTNDSLAKDASCNLNCSQLPPDPSGASDNTYKFSSIQSTSLTSPRQQFNNQSTSTARLTPYEKASHALNHDDHWRKDITLGKRAGFYRLKGDIGSGNFSQVKLAIHHLTKEKVAVKILDKSKLDAKTQIMLSREIAIMEQLCHPNIIQIYEVIHSPSKVHLFMEYASEGELFARINQHGRLHEHQAKMVFAQIVSAVDYMHSKSIIHRDLKSENVFFCNHDMVKVGDFGFSTTVRCMDQTLQTFCGSPPYAAPELFQDDSYLGPPVDIWALGILLYFIVSGYMPFHAPTVVNLKRNILNGEFEIPSHVSIECATLIRGILRKSYRDRYTMSQVVESVWLKDGVTTLGTTGQRKKWGPWTSSSKLTGRRNYHPWPRVDRREWDELETEVRNQMMKLGMDETIITDNLKDGCTSNVIGTYRLLLDVTSRSFKSRKNSHNVKESADDIGTVEQNPEESLSQGGVDSSKSVSPGQNKKSRTCMII